MSLKTKCDECGKIVIGLAGRLHEKGGRYLCAQCLQTPSTTQIMSDPSVARIIVTTTPIVPNRATDQVLDIISAECVLGMNLFKDFSANLTDIAGGRNAPMQKALRTARLTVLAELRAEAANIGANAVVGTALSYSEISGGGKSMLFVVATGTAIRLKPI